METLRRKRNDKVKLKEQIVETAMEAFTKLGIRCVRMDDIALSLFHLQTHFVRTVS